MLIRRRISLMQPAALITTGSETASTGQWHWVGLPIARLMLEPAKIYFLIFGVLTIAGGIMGYVKARSVVSVIAGTTTGILLIVAGLVLPDHRELGLVLALLTSAILAAQFIPRALRTRRFMPGGMMSILSVIGIVMAIAAWVGK